MVEEAILPLAEMVGSALVGCDRAPFTEKLLSRKVALIILFLTMIVLSNIIIFRALF